MRFNKHYNLTGKHAVLSASKSAWVNYDDEKLESFFMNAMAAQRGTELHALAAEMIRLGIKAQSNRSTLSLYVNDAIGFRMKPEQVLYYSDNAFGTADACSFRRGKLRIFDLKTGVKEAGERQLEIYDAFFCLEYNIKPFEIEHDLRIYQNNQVRVYEPDPADILQLMDRIRAFDKRIAAMRQEIDD